MSVRTEIDRIIGAVEAAHTDIVEKGGTTVRPYLVGNLADAINTIPVSADPKLQTKTVSPATSTQTVKPDSGYDGLSQVTVNAMPTATQATPSISVSSGGLITASATQSAGYVTAGTKKATKQLTVQAAQTITPGTANKTIASGRYLTGTQTIKGDANLVGDNISTGVSIFGVNGTNPYEKTATDVIVNTQTDLLAQIQTALEGKAAGGGGGGSTENCTVTLAGEAVEALGMSFVNGELDFLDSYPTGTYAKNTMIVVRSSSARYRNLTIDGDAKMLMIDGTSFYVFVKNDCTITIS